MTAVVRFRISSHKLKIETGQYTRTKTEIYQRICTYCNSHEVENETHFLCKCRYFTDERNILYRTCSKIIPEIQNMYHENILIQLLSSAGPVVILDTAKFIHAYLKKECLTTHRINENNWELHVGYNK